MPDTMIQSQRTRGTITTPRPVEREPRFTRLDAVDLQAMRTSGERDGATLFVGQEFAVGVCGPPCRPGRLAIDDKAAVQEEP
jgi:hypothetical protein